MKFFYAFLFSFFAFWSVDGTLVNALDTGFSVEKVPSAEETVRGPSISWFEFAQNSREKDLEISFIVQNHSSVAKQIAVEPRDAHAQANQLLDVTYPRLPIPENNVILNDASLFSQYAKELPMIFTLNGGERKQITLKVSVPPTDGEVLGAFAFYEKTEHNESETSQADFSNHFTLTSEYVISVHFLAGASPEKKFNFKNASAFTNTSFFGVEFTVENPNSFLESQRVDYTIQRLNGKVVFSSDESLLFKMPPDASTTYQIPWLDSEPRKGDYLLILNDQELPFTIGNETLTEKESVLPEPDRPFDLTLLLLGCIMILLSLNSLYIVYTIRKRRKNV